MVFQSAKVVVQNKVVRMSTVEIEILETMTLLTTASIVTTSFSFDILISYQQKPAGLEDTSAGYKYTGPG